MSKSKSKTYTTSELAKYFDISVVSASRFIVKHKFKPIKTGQHNAKYYNDAVFKQMEEYYQNNPKTQEKQTYPATKDAIIDQLKARIEEIKTRIANTTNDYDKKQYQERLGKLTNGVATIKVGATTESELKEKKLRIEDALNATKAAVSEGIVIGGGAALVEAYKELKPVLKNDNVDIQKGINIVMSALLAPISQIAQNAGYNCEDIVEEQKVADKNIGFDAKDGKWVDMFEAGIIDPTKVTRSALLNAASISALFITTEVGVAEIKSDEPQTPAMPGGMY